jgi:hypothetical protein
MHEEQGAGTFLIGYWSRMFRANLAIKAIVICQLLQNHHNPVRRANEQAKRK